MHHNTAKEYSDHQRHMDSDMEDDSALSHSTTEAAERQSPAHDGAKAFSTRHKMDKIPSEFKQGADQDKLDPMIRSLCIKIAS